MGGGGGGGGTPFGLDYIVWACGATFGRITFPWGWGGGGGGVFPDFCFVTFISFYGSLNAFLTGTLGCLIGFMFVGASSYFLETFLAFSCRLFIAGKLTIGFELFLYSVSYWVFCIK